MYRMPTLAWPETEKAAPLPERLFYADGMRRVFSSIW
jgi:hypothetical protein